MLESLQGPKEAGAGSYAPSQGRRPEHAHGGNSVQIPTHLPNKYTDRVRILRRTGEQTPHESAFLALVLKKKLSQEKLIWIFLFTRKMSRPSLLFHVP